MICSNPVRCFSMLTDVPIDHQRPERRSAVAKTIESVRRCSIRCRLRGHGERAFRPADRACVRGGAKRVRIELDQTLALRVVADEVLGVVPGRGQRVMLGEFQPCSIQDAFRGIRRLMWFTAAKSSLAGPGTGDRIDLRWERRQLFDQRSQWSVYVEELF